MAAYSNLKNLKKKKRGGGIGTALGLANASLGMRVTQSMDTTGAPTADNPLPGTPAFGARADQRKRRLQGKQPFRPERNDDLNRQDLEA